MGKVIVIAGNSGVGKTTLVGALCRARPFATGLEQHAERPFQALMAADPTRYALANQFDYLLLRAEQERVFRAGPATALIDGGFDLDFHGFTRLFTTGVIWMMPSSSCAGGSISNSATSLGRLISSSISPLRSRSSRPATLGAVARWKSPNATIWHKCSSLWRSGSTASLMRRSFASTLRPMIGAPIPYRPTCWRGSIANI